MEACLTFAIVISTNVPFEVNPGCLVVVTDGSCHAQDKLAYFRIKELKDVLTQLGLSKQGRKQVRSLVDFNVAVCMNVVCELLELLQFVMRPYCAYWVTTVFLHAELLSHTHNLFCK